MNSKKQCFWCKCSLPYKSKNKLNQRTKDHFLCKFIRFKYPCIESNFYCWACSQCNSARGRISVAFELIYRLNRNNPKIGMPKYNKISKIVENLHSCGNLLKFKKVIEEELCGQLKNLCLMEIDEVLQYKP